MGAVLFAMVVVIGMLGMAACDDDNGASINALFMPAPTGTSAVGTRPNAVAIADFNLDGKLDMAVANFGDNKISVFCSAYFRS